MTDSIPPSEPGRPPARPPWIELGLAHDINALLGIILGRSQLLLEQSDDPEDRRQLGHIVAAARDAADHVKEILDGKTGFPDASVPLTRVVSVIEDCRELVQPPRDTATSDPGAAVNFEIDVPDEVTVRCAPTDLRRILINLFANALAAMPDGGNLRVQGRAAGEEVLLVIEDTGPGLDAATLTHLFEPGFTTGKPLGRGLGLAISQDVARRLGGHIQVTSQPGQGTKFTLHFPRLADTAGANEQVLPGPELSTCRVNALTSGPGHDSAGRSVPGESDGAGHDQVAPQRILVVDNEGSVRDMLAEVLTGDGHTVVVAAAGSEALQKYQPGACDLVLADLTLPGMDGLELVRNLRKLDRIVAIAVISGWSSRFMQEADRDKSVDLTATKPLDVQQLRQLVAAATAIVAERRNRADASRG